MPKYGKTCQRCFLVIQGVQTISKYLKIKCSYMDPNLPAGFLKFGSVRLIVCPTEVFYEKRGVFKNLAKFTGKHLCRSLFYNKVVGIRLSTPFLQNTSGRMLLHNDGLAVEVFSNRAFGTRLPLF